MLNYLELQPLRSFEPGTVPKGRKKPSLPALQDYYQLFAVHDKKGIYHPSSSSLSGSNSMGPSACPSYRHHSAQKLEVAQKLGHQRDHQLAGEGKGRKTQSLENNVNR